MRNWQDVEAEAADLAAPLFHHEDGVRKALDRLGDLSFERLVNKVRAQQAVIFTGDESIAVLSIHRDPHDVTATLILVTGRYAECVMLAEAATMYAYENGATRIMTVARPGWSRDPWIRAVWGKPLAHVYERRLRERPGSES